MEKETQKSLADLYAVRAATSLAAVRLERSATSAARRTGRGKPRVPRFSSLLCFWQRLWTDFTNLGLFFGLSGLSSRFCMILDVLFPVLQVSAAVILAVFGAMGKLAFAGVAMRCVFLLLVLSPALCRLLLCIGIGIAETRVRRLTFLREISNAAKLCEAAERAYPPIARRDWGDVDLLIRLLERGTADTLERAKAVADGMRGDEEGRSRASAEVCAALGSGREIPYLTESFGKLSRFVTQDEGGDMPLADAEALHAALQQKRAVPSDALATVLIES